MKALARALAAAPGAVLWGVRYARDGSEFDTGCSDTPREALELFAPGPRTLIAWRRKALTEDDIVGVVEDWIERANEWYQDEFGDEDGNPPDFDGERELLASIVDRVLRAQTPWQCEEIARIDLTAEEVAEIVGEK